MAGLAMVVGDGYCENDSFAMEPQQPLNKPLCRQIEDGDRDSELASLRERFLKEKKEGKDALKKQLAGKMLTLIEERKAA